MAIEFIPKLLIYEDLLVILSALKSKTANSLFRITDRFVTVHKMLYKKMLHTEIKYNVLGYYGKNSHLEDFSNSNPLT